MKVEHLQESFSVGEIAPTLFGRVDIAQYGNALKTLQNFLVKPYGEVVSCPGTEFINDAKNSGPGNRGDDTTVVTETDLVLYLKMNGSDGSTTFIDSTGRHTVVSNSSSTAQIDTAQSYLGGASGLFAGGVEDSGVGDHLRIADSSDFHVNNDNYTFEFNFYPTEYSGPFAGQGQFLGNNHKRWSYGESGSLVNFSIITANQSNGVVVFEGSILKSEFQLNTWHHIAFIKENSSYIIYLDGVDLNGEITNGAADPIDTYLPNEGALTDDFTIGKTGRNGVTDSYFFGWMDEVKFWQKLVYTENFTPPISEFPYGSQFKARLIDFVFSRTDAYIIEMGVGYFRFYTDGAAIEA